MAEPDRRRRKGLKKSLSFFWTALSVVAAAAAVIFALTVFFKTGTITVTGTLKLDHAEVIEASGLKTGGNLFLTKTDKAEERIFETFSYAQAVTIKRRLPDTLVIDIVEAIPTAHIEHEGALWLVSRTGRLLEMVDISAPQGFTVTGCALSEPVIGQSITGTGSVGSSGDSLVALMDTLYEQNALGLVNAIDMTRSFAVSFQYDRRFDVNIGTLEDLEYKIEYFLRIVENLTDADRGSIDVSTSPGRFIPA